MFVCSRQQRTSQTLANIYRIYHAYTYIHRTYINSNREVYYIYTRNVYFNNDDDDNDDDDDEQNETKRLESQGDREK